MDPVWLKLMDYGLLGIAVLVFGWVIFRGARFIVDKFEESAKRCEDDRKALIMEVKKREEQFTAYQGGAAIELQKTAAQCTAAAVTCAKASDRVMDFLEKEKTERHHNHRSGEHRR